MSKKSEENAKVKVEKPEAAAAENKESGLLTGDRVHLTAAGNQLVADEMMKALSLQ